MFTLEIIFDTELDAGAQKTIELSVRSHVHKRIEKFQFLKHIRDENVPLDYVYGTKANSIDNLVINDLSTSIRTNARATLRTHNLVVRTESQYINTPYRDLILTNKTYVDQFGNLRPLFYKHRLPTGTLRAWLVKEDNTKLVEDGWVVDGDFAFTNYRNSFNQQTGEYTVYYVVAETATGSTHQLLNSVPAAEEATWEDIDLSTGILNTDTPTWVREVDIGGYQYTMSQRGPWYGIANPTSAIHLLPPEGLYLDDSWFVRVNAGEFRALRGGVSRRYWIPEYTQQAFTPYFPIRYSTYESALVVSNKLIKTNREFIKIDPDNHIHFNAYIYDDKDVLIAALTTDTTLASTRYSDTDVFYRLGITEWDEQTGLVQLEYDIASSYKVWVSYFFQAKDFEYTLVDFNLSRNTDLKDYLHVLYMVPDAHESDRAVHHLLVNQAGIIVYCSQTAGINVSNRSLSNPDGSYNTDTVVGMWYKHDTEDNFNDDFAGINSDAGYFILGEVSLRDTNIKSNVITIDVRKQGKTIKEDLKSLVYSKSPKLLQSVYGYGPDGQEISKNNVVIVDVPLSVLNTYGGAFTEDQVHEQLRSRARANTILYINYVWPSTEFGAWSTITGEVTITGEWQGDLGYNYMFYRSNSKTGPFEEILALEDPAENFVTYIDRDVESGKTYWYQLRIWDPDTEIEYPSLYSISVKVM